MKIKKIKDIMVPLEEYATVSEEASLYDAVVALHNAQKVFSTNQYQHKSVLVYDKNNRITGKISPLDVLRGLEPKYKQLGHSDPLSTIGLSRFGISPEFIKTLITQYSLWDEPIDVLAEKAAGLKAKEFMYTPSDGEYVDEESSLAEAIHQLVLGHHQSLLVLKGTNIVGILRLVDIFKKICDSLLAHEDHNRP